MQKEHEDKLREFIGKIVPLDPELEMYITEENGMTVFKHRFCVLPFYTKASNFFINQFVKQQTERAEEALKEKDYSSFIWTHERPFRLNAILEIARFCTPKLKAELLSHIWTDCEFPHINEDTWRMLFKQIRNSNHLMTDEELKAYNKLDPTLVTVYRGVSIKPYSGISWTLDKDKALWFANRFSDGDKQFLLTAVVPTEKIIALLNGRGESECIIADKIYFTHEEIK